jgi:myosin heavy subunit
MCVPKIPITADHTLRYKIIAPAACEKAGGDPKKCAAAILEGAGLDPDQYRLGHTKA